jgi:hypothetical protein
MISSLMSSPRRRCRRRRIIAAPGGTRRRIGDGDVGWIGSGQRGHTGAARRSIVDGVLRRHGG